MKTIYLVKSSETLEDGTIYWENLKVFETIEGAEAFAAKVAKMIEYSEDLDDTDQVEIEEFTLEA